MNDPVDHRRHALDALLTAATAVGLAQSTARTHNYRRAQEEIAIARRELERAMRHIHLSTQQTLAM